MALFNLLVQVFGGLAIFLYGLRLLSGGLEKLASSRMQKMLERLTDRPLKGVAFGATTTAVLQSSSLLMVTLIGLLNANLLTLKQAVGIILGMEIGTTMTAQLISFKVWGAYMYFIIAGFFTIFFAKKERTKLFGQIVFGAGLIFMGMAIMSTGSKMLGDIPQATAVISLLSRNLLLGVVAGTVFTAIIQSSSAMTGLVIAMGAAGTINLPFAIALILGSNLGTCVTGILASVGSKVSAKRASAAQVVINLVGVLIFLPFITQYANLIALTSAEMPRQIANAHTIFNVVVTLIKLPFIALLVRFIVWLVPGETDSLMCSTKFIDERLLNIPSLALSNAAKEVSRLGGISLGMLRQSRRAILELNAGEMKKSIQTESAVDDITLKTQVFLDKLAVRDLSQEGRDEVTRLRDNLVDIERVSDLATNISEFSGELMEAKLHLPKERMLEVERLFSKVIEGYETSLKALESKDVGLARRVLKLEDEVDSLHIEYRSNFEKHSKRENYDPVIQTVFVETLHDLERVSDHANNIADTLLGLGD